MELVPWNCSQIVVRDAILLDRHPRLARSFLEWESEVNCSAEMPLLSQITPFTCHLPVPYVNVLTYPVTLHQTFHADYMDGVVTLTPPCLADLPLQSIVPTQCNTTHTCERRANATSNGTHVFLGSSCLEPWLIPTQAPSTTQPTPQPTIIITLTRTVNTRVYILVVVGVIIVGLGAGLYFV